MKVQKDEINTYDLCNLMLKSFYHLLGYLVSLKTILQIRYSTNHGIVLKQAIVFLSFVNIQVILRYRSQNSCFRTMRYQCFKRNKNSATFRINNFQHSSPIFFLIFSLGSHQIKVPNTVFSLEYNRLAVEFHLGRRRRRHQKVECRFRQVRSRTWLLQRIPRMNFSLRACPHP